MCSIGVCFFKAPSLEEASSYTAQLDDLLADESQEHLLVPAAVLESYSMTRIAEKIQRLQEMLSITPPETNRYKKCLSDLADWYKLNFDRTNDISDIEESIKYRWLELKASHYSDLLRISSLRDLSNILFLAFEKTSKIRYLDESITIGYDLLKSDSARPSHLHIVNSLGHSLLTREQLLGRREDRHEVIRLISMVINDQYARDPTRFKLACQWTSLHEVSVTPSP